MIAPLLRYGFVTGTNIFTNRSMDGGKEPGFVIFGNRGPWRSRMSFSQGAGLFVGVWFIGFISTTKGCCIDREAETLPSTVFLFGIRDRG